MKNKFKILILSFLLFLFSSCTVNILNKYKSYSQSNKYHVLDSAGEEVIDEFNNIELDWVSGKVTIESTNQYSNVFLKETTNMINQDEFLSHIFVEDETLKIKYAASGASIPAGYSKELIIYIPENKEIEEFQFNNVSSNIDFNNVSIEDLELNNVSGNVNINNSSFNTFEFSSVSGNLIMTTNNIPKKIEINQVSGSTIVSLNPEIKGFTVNFDTISGKFFTDFDMQYINNKYMYMDYSVLEIKVTSESGNVTITKTYSQIKKLFYK